jgi:hypothetical protein
MKIFKRVNGLMVKFKIEHNRAPVSLPCFDYKGEDDGPIRKTVIIAPIKIIECEGGSIQVSWGCSRGAFCKDQNCRYSHAAEESEYANKGFLDF